MPTLFTKAWPRSIPQTTKALFFGNLMFKFIVLLSTFLGTMSASFAASFNCDKPLSGIETAICADQKISDLDRYLADIYQAVLDVSKNPASEKNEQRQWIANVRENCKTSAACLLKVYDERTTELENRWMSRRSQLHRVAASKAHIPSKPFEGKWTDCFVLRGGETCISQIFVQEGKKICGEWNMFATYTIYSGHFQAVEKSSKILEMTYKCGDESSFTTTSCQTENEPGGGWEKADEELRIVNNRINMFDGNSLRLPLDKAVRKKFVSEPWVKECLADVKPTIKATAKPK